MVKARIPYMRGRPWHGGYRALGVIRRGVLVGGAVYHDYRGFDIMVSVAFDRIGWALPGTLRALFAYPFLDLGCKRMTALTARKNKPARKLLTDLGFHLEGTMKYGIDGFDDACLYGMTREHCRWIKDHAKRKSTPASP